MKKIKAFKKIFALIFLILFLFVLTRYVNSLFPLAQSSADFGQAPIYSDQSSARFAVIGDFGEGGKAEADVASLVKGWSPDFIVTTGDNSYTDNRFLPIDQNIGFYYHSFIAPYSGEYGTGSSVNRFFPALGNHDWNMICFRSMCLGEYLKYFTLPGNERYYDFVWGDAHFFVLDSDPREPEGTSADSLQGRWLKERLAGSNSTWNIVVAHHPPYSSGEHGSTQYMQWPYKEWGANLVLSGHDHDYERIVIDNLPYIVNGLGGKSEYQIKTPIVGSQISYSADYGAMLVEAGPSEMALSFVTRSGKVIDKFIIQKPGLSLK